MTENLDNLARLLRAWRWRVRLTAQAESVLCTLLAAGIAAVAVFAARAALGHDRVRPVEPAVAALGFVILLAPLLSTRVRCRLGRRTGVLLDMAVGWLAGWLLLGPLWRQATASGLAAGTIVAVFAVVLAPAILRHLRIAGPAVAAWLDEQTNSRMLLTTADELADVSRQMSHVERAVLARANCLAGTPAAFAAVSARRLPGRTWALLPVVALAVVLAGWICTASARSAAAGRDLPASPDQSSSANQFVAAQLAALAKTAGESGPPNVTNALQDAATNLSGNDNSGVDRLMQPLKAEMSATGPATAEMTALAGLPAGQPLLAVVADPNQSPDQAADAARDAVQQWRADALTPAQRTDLAQQLRDAADRVRANDPVLAELLSRAAEGLIADDWDAVADGMAALARHVLPIVRRHRLAESGVRVLAEAISRTSEPFAATSDRTGQPTGSTPAATWWSGDPANNAGELDKLSPEQQQIVRRYFEPRSDNR